MKSTDTALYAAWAAMTHAMKTHTAFSADERVSLVALDVKLDAATTTTKAEDMFINQCMKKYISENPNY